MKETKKEKPSRLAKKAKAKPLKKTPNLSRMKPVKKAQVKVKRKITTLEPAFKPRAIKKKEAPIAVAQAVEKVQKIIPPVVVIPPVPAAVIITEAVTKKEKRPQRIITKRLVVREVKKEVPALEVKVVALAPAPVPSKELELKLPITVKDLSVRLQEKPSVLIKTLMNLGVMAGINNVLEESIVTKICQKYDFTVKKAPEAEELALEGHAQPDRPEFLKPRSPIVTLMGHVDHGKTSLLDAIRKSKVVESEHGGITQHIGAYRVVLAHGEITFLDTPGHEAFTAMRARGAKVTDIVVLVVAADDGVMPQTKEAIDHARAAGVSIMVAINKIDKPQADVDKVKKQLSELNLLPEDWGGKTITVLVSAKTGKGIDDLLEMILLESQMLELKANPQRLAKGVVLEGKMVKSKGPVVTLLIQSGTLHLNENIIVGKYYGKVRAMFNDQARPVAEARPSLPVEVLGISGVPEAGEQFFVIADEKTAKDLTAKRQEQGRLAQMQPVKRLGLEDLYSQIKEGKIKELKLILKADAQGSLGAIKEVLNKIETAEIKLNIIHDGVGNINSSDVILALASDALILGFNVITDDLAKELSAKEGQDIRIYNVIYDLANDIKAALEGMLEPKLKKVFLGKAEIKKVLNLSRSGTVAGCLVTKGKITRQALINIVRNGKTVFEGELASLRRFKDDVREVEEGFECGMGISGFDGILEGDLIEAYQVEKIARKL